MADRRVLSQINVTPLVDVMLVLLIIFMVTAPMMQEGIEVNLPKVEAAGLPIPEEPLVVTVDKKGNTYLNSAKLKKGTLRKKLEAIYKKRKDKTILLKADRAVPYGFVVAAMSEIRKAGVYNIGMATEPTTGRR
ncbi:MAG: protein TolR [Thermodesulfobacteriota bacterium]